MIDLLTDAGNDGVDGLWLFPYSNRFCTLNCLILIAWNSIVTNFSYSISPKAAVETRVGSRVGSETSTHCRQCLVDKKTLLSSVYN